MTGWRMHGWVLMGNHYHLLLQTPEANLVAGMRWLKILTPGASTRDTVRGAGSLATATKRCCWRIRPTTMNVAQLHHLDRCGPG